MPRILETNNYGKFILSPFNREVGKTWRMEQSLLKHGWEDEYPMPVIRQADGRLMITQADRDGTHKIWSLKDYMGSFAKNNLADLSPARSGSPRLSSYSNPRP